MPLSQLMNDTVDLLKTNGAKTVDLKASVQRDKIFMDAGQLLIETGDLVIRRMSNGAEETYRVIDPGFHEAFHGIAAHYQMDVEKLGVPDAKRAVQSITYVISGSNTRINQNSIDNSTNIVHLDARVTQHIEALRTALMEARLPSSEHDAAIELVDEVEIAFRSGSPKKSIVSALLKSLPQAANIASIVSAILGLM